MMLDDRSPRWEAAACTQTAWPDMWHGDGETANQGDTAKAITICQRCDIRTDCFEYAYVHGLSGIFGATTTKQRKTKRKNDAKEKNIR